MNPIIRQRENGKWQAIISYKDRKGKWKQKPKGGFDKQKDAKLWAKEMSFKLQKLEKSGILGNEYTLEETFELFIEMKAQTVSEGTIKGYKRSLKFFETFKNEEVNSIKSIDLLNYVKEQRKKTGNLYNDYIDKLKTIFSFAVDDLHACEYNPCNLLYKDKTDSDNRIKFIDKSFYKEILDSMNTEKKKLLIRVLYETGMRIGEALGICTQYVKNRLIEVKNQWNTGTRTMTPVLKTQNSYRFVPISEELYKDLKRATFDINGRIFFDVSYDYIRLKLQSFNTSCHCFRHTRSTILVSSGIDLTVIASIIGDKIETILKTYVNVNTDEIDDKYEKVRALI